MGRPWFAPKEIGYGATPSTWEGWLATLGFVVFVCLSVSFVDPRAHGLPAMLGLRSLPGLHDLVLSFNASLVVVIVESIAFTLFARWKSSGPWLRR